MTPSAYASTDIAVIAPRVLELVYTAWDMAPFAAEVVYRFRPDPEDATADERRAGAMRRTLTITVTARDGRRTVRKSQSVDFEVRLNTERVIRRVGNLGAILGLMPKGSSS